MAVLACVQRRAATKAWSAPASRAVSPRPSIAGSKLALPSPSISPSASVHATSFGGRDVRTSAVEFAGAARRWSSGATRPSVTVEPFYLGVEGAPSPAPAADVAKDETQRNSDEARETSRRRRREHAAAMGALHALGSAADAGALRSSIAAAEAHVRILPALEEELQVARLRLQTLGAEKVAGVGGGLATISDDLGGSRTISGGLATISEVADHTTHAERGWTAHEWQGRTPSVAVPLAELRAATTNFDEAAKVGEGGFASVYRAAHLPSIPGVQDVAIKKHHVNATMAAGAWRGARGTPPQSTLATLGQSLSANQSPDFADLQQEVALLQRCSHAHLLPLLGHCLERTAPCLLFPLCVGGSLQARLQPSAGEHWTSLQRLGFWSVPPPLGWRQRLQVVQEASEALSYLHTPTATKPRIVHRDVKPANILLDANLHARLADTGFAKATQHADERLTLSVGQGACYTPGYADPIIINGSEYSAVTDGYAVGMTLLVCLTNRSPIAMVDRCEAEFGREWDEISGHEIAGGTDWPPDVADAIKRLCFAGGSSHASLCADRRRNRLSIDQMLHQLRELQGTPA